MKEPLAESGPSQVNGSRDFSLASGRSLARLLTGSERPLLATRQGAYLIPLIAWVPLLILSATSGKLFGDSIAVPFLLDVEAHVRLLAALPLLIIAELASEERVRQLPQQFAERNLVPEKAVKSFDAATASALRQRNSVVAAVALIVLVYSVGISIWYQHIALNTDTWYMTSAPSGSHLTPAGFWYGAVSLPVFQFLLCRWYFRLFVWTRFLWRVSRIPLSLLPTHPDRVGGLSFLSTATHAYTWVAAAHGTLLAGYIATRVLSLGIPLTQYKLEIMAMLALVLSITLGPLLVFAPQLSQAKRAGLREYGTFAGRYVRAFDAKWLRDTAAKTEPLLGSPDIQSLADLNTGYSAVRGMRMAPVSKDTVFRLSAAMLVPIAPLLLTMMSADEALKRLASILF